MKTHRQVKVFVLTLRKNGSSAANQISKSTAISTKPGFGFFIESPMQKNGMACLGIQQWKKILQEIKSYNRGKIILEVEKIRKFCTFGQFKSVRIPAKRGNSSESVRWKTKSGLELVKYESFQ